MLPTHDLIVVGGGPAGLATALAAARAGLDVALVERRAGPDAAPIDKACGEGLMPSALRALQGWGIDPSGHHISGITYRQDELSVSAAFTAHAGRGVRRTVLHEELCRAVAAAGIRMLSDTVTSVQQDDTGVSAAGLRARYLVAADGLTSPIRASLGLDRPARGPRRWGQRQHYRLAPWTDRVEVTWTPTCETYVTPVATDTVGVAVLTTERAGFADLVTRVPELAERLAGADAVSAVRGAGPLRRRVVRRVAGRVLLVGDAAGYLDALTGEGLALSFAAATRAVDCVLRGRPEDYERAWRSASRRSRWLTAGLLAARNNGVLGPRVVPLAARAPWLFTTAVNQLAR